MTIKTLHEYLSPYHRGWGHFSPGPSLDTAEAYFESASRKTFFINWCGAMEFHLEPSRRVSEQDDNFERIFKSFAETMEKILDKEYETYQGGE